MWLFGWMCTIACCFVVGSGLGLGLGIGLVSGWNVFMHTYLYYVWLSLSPTLIIDNCLLLKILFTILLGEISMRAIYSDAVMLCREPPWLDSRSCDWRVAINSSDVRHRLHLVATAAPETTVFPPRCVFPAVFPRDNSRLLFFEGSNLYRCC